MGKQQGTAFLAALPAPWATLLPPARAACQAAVVAAGTAREAADAAACARSLRNQRVDYEEAYAKVSQSTFSLFFSLFNCCVYICIKKDTNS